MTDLSHARVGDIVEDVVDFFAPASTDLVDGLIGGYLSDKARIDHLNKMMTGGGFSSALYHFMEGNTSDQGRYYTTDIARLMQLPPALASLNASYWGKALALTDVYDCMPQKRREEWQAQIRNPMGVKSSSRRRNDEVRDEWEVHPLPEFEEQKVRSTLTDLLLARSKFFAERVDGMFRALLGKHLTNSQLRLIGIGHWTADHGHYGDGLTDQKLPTIRRFHEVLLACLSGRQRRAGGFFGSAISLNWI